MWRSQGKNPRQLVLPHLQSRSGCTHACFLAHLRSWSPLYTVQNPLPRAWCHPQWTESSHLRHQDNPSGMSIGRLSKQCSYMVGVWVSALNFLSDGPWPGSQIFSLLQIVFFKNSLCHSKRKQTRTGKYLQLLWLLSNFPISRFLQICVVCVLIEALFTNFSLRMACLSCQFCFHQIPTQLFVVLQSCVPGSNSNSTSNG